MDFSPEEEAAWQREYDRLKNELYSHLGAEDDEIEAFRAERLSSYYLRHPDVAAPAYEALTYAQSLLSEYPKAALVFATTAVELTIKSALLKPMVFGLIHTEALADAVAEIIILHGGMDRLRDVLFAILRRFAAIDLLVYRREGAAITLWQEFLEMQKARNAVLHRGDTPDDSVCRLAVVIGTVFVSQVLPRMVDNIGLHTHEKSIICGDSHFPD